MTYRKLLLTQTKASEELLLGQVTTSLCPVQQNIAIVESQNPSKMKGKKDQFICPTIQVLVLTVYLARSSLMHVSRRKLKVGILDFLVLWMGSQLLLPRGDTHLFMVSNSLVAQDYNAECIGLCLTCHWPYMHPSKVCWRFWASNPRAWKVTWQLSNEVGVFLTFCVTTGLDMYARASEPSIWHDSVQVELV